MLLMVRSLSRKSSVFRTPQQRIAHQLHRKLSMCQAEGGQPVSEPRSRAEVGVGVDLEQIRLARSPHAKIGARIIAAAQELECMLCQRPQSLRQLLTHLRRAARRGCPEFP